MDNQKNAQNNIETIIKRLGSEDITSVFSTHYSGPGCGQIFKTEADVINLRLGRKHAEGHEDYTFSEHSSNPMAMLAHPPSEYTIFLPLTDSNIKSIKAGKNFEYVVVDGFEEDKDGWVTQVYTGSTQFRKGNLEDLKRLMPKRRISGTSSVDVKIGNLITDKVTCSNADDNGDVEIKSLTGYSSLLYNPQADQPFRPAYQWGSSGWKGDIKVSVKHSKLYFDDSRSGAGDGGVWEIRFKKEGYEAIKVK